MTHASVFCKMPPKGVRILGRGGRGPGAHHTMLEGQAATQGKREATRGRARERASDHDEARWRDGPAGRSARRASGRREPELAQISCQPQLFYGLYSPKYNSADICGFAPGRPGDLWGVKPEVSGERALYQHKNMPETKEHARHAGPPSWVKF